MTRAWQEIWHNWNFKTINHIFLSQISFGFYYFYLWEKIGEALSFQIKPWPRRMASEIKTYKIVLVWFRLFLVTTWSDHYDEQPFWKTPLTVILTGKRNYKGCEICCFIVLFSRIFLACPVLFLLMKIFRDIPLTFWITSRTFCSSNSERDS